jgi:hypothetical protein
MSRVVMPGVRSPTTMATIKMARITDDEEIPIMEKRREKLPKKTWIRKWIHVSN